MKASSRIFEYLFVWLKQIRKLGTEYSFSKTTLLSSMEIPTDSSSLVSYGIYTFAQKNDMRFGLWIVFEYRLAICQGYVKIVIFRALYCFFIYLYQWWICLCGVISVSPHCFLCPVGRVYSFKKDGFFCFILNIRRNMWTVVQSHVEWWAA